MTLTVTNAWNQKGWGPNDHQLGDKISDMVGRTYRDLAALKRAAQKLAESYPTVEYHDGDHAYRYDGSPTTIPGRPVQVIKDLGPL